MIAQHTIDAQTHPKIVGAWLDVDVACTRRKRVKDDLPEEMKRWSAVRRLGGVAAIVIPARFGRRSGSARSVDKKCTESRTFQDR